LSKDPDNLKKINVDIAHQLIKINEYNQWKKDTTATINSQKIQTS